MNTQDLKMYIDRVLGSSIRCLLPSYWWKRIFHAVVDKCDAEVASVASAVDSIEQEVGSKVDFVIVSGQDSDIEKNKEAYKVIKARGYDKPLYIWYRNTPEGNRRFRVDYRFGAGYWDVIDGAMKWYIILFNVNASEGDRTLNTFFVKLYEDGTLSGNNTIYEDSYMSETSERAVQNKVVKAYVDVSVAPLATKDELAESEEVAAAALVDLEDRKADKADVDEAIAALKVPTLAKKEELAEAEEVAAAALNDLKDALGNLDIDIDTSTIVTKDEFTDVEEVWAASYNLLNQKISDVQQYIYDEAASRRQFDEAIAEIQSILLENEAVVTAAWNQLNTRINALEAAQAQGE